MFYREAEDLKLSIGVDVGWQRICEPYIHQTQHDVQTVQQFSKWRFKNEAKAKKPKYDEDHPTRDMKGAYFEPIIKTCNKIHEKIFCFDSPG